jgi:hypothetical protein
MLLIIWVVVFFSIFFVLMILATGVYLGILTLLLPGMTAIFFVMILEKTSWFAKRIHEPFSNRLRASTALELVAHSQIFSIICGALGIGIGVLAINLYNPHLLNAYVESLTDSPASALYFKSNAGVAAFVGFVSAGMVYCYMLAEAKGMRKMSAIVIMVTCLLLFAIGLTLKEPMDTDLIAHNPYHKELSIYDQ